MGERREIERRSVTTGGVTVKRKKKKRRRSEEAISFQAEDLQLTSAFKTVDSSKTLLKVACAEFGQKKRRLNAAQSDWHSYGLSGEVSSEEEKRSLLAWIEDGIQPNSDVVSMKEGKGYSKSVHASNHSPETLSGTLNGVDSSLKRKTCIPRSLMNHNKHSLARSSKGHVSDSCVFEKDSLIENPRSGNGIHGHFAGDASIESLVKDTECNLTSNLLLLHKNKRKREVDKVLEYVNKRCIVVKSPTGALKGKCRTRQTVVTAWGRSIHVTLTSEASAVEQWISSYDGHLFGLDVEWRPNRLKGQRNKVALLQLSNEEECLIIQLLFLDKQPQALRNLLSDPSKGLAGVGVLADGKRLLQDYGLKCQGAIELTALAVERLKREELRKVGLKVLMQEVLGLALQKSKRVTLSNWAKERLDGAQIRYACMDAWASFALAQKLLVTS